MKVYLDTSALNWLVDNPNHQIQKLERVSNFVLSINNLWEILLNSDRLRSDKVIYWCQINCEKYLLKSNSEILIDFIKNDCPISSRKKFWEQPYTNSQIGKLWTQIHGKIDRNLNFDYEGLVERTQAIRLLSKKFRKIIESTFQKESNDDYFVEQLINLMKKLQIDDFSKYQKTFLIAIIVVEFIFCIGIELDNSAIREYWKIKNIEDPLLRLEYLIDNHPIFFNRGPIAEMTRMIETQFTMTNNKSRGLIHDCLHLQYAYYCNIFLSNDDHFLKVSENLVGEAYKSIKSVSNLKNND